MCQRAVYRQGSTSPVSSLQLLDSWIPPDLRGFFYSMETSETLNKFAREVVQVRSTARIQAWKNWLREDLSRHPDTLKDPHRIEAKFQKHGGNFSGETKEITTFFFPQLSKAVPKTATCTQTHQQRRRHWGFHVQPVGQPFSIRGQALHILFVDPSFLVVWCMQSRLFLSRCPLLPW